MTRLTLEASFPTLRMRLPFRDPLLSHLYRPTCSMVWRVQSTASRVVGWRTISKEEFSLTETDFRDRDKFLFLSASSSTSRTPIYLFHHTFVYRDFVEHAQYQKECCTKSAICEFLCHCLSRLASPSPTPKSKHVELVAVFLQ
jgi:hypothetical protein